VRAAGRAADAAESAARPPGARATHAAARELLRSRPDALADALTQALHARLAAGERAEPVVDSSPAMLDAARIDETIAVARAAQALAAAGPAAPALVPAHAPLLAAGLRDGLAAQVSDPEVRLALLGLLGAALAGASAPADAGRPAAPGGGLPSLAATLARLVVQAHAARGPGRTETADPLPPDALPPAGRAAVPALEPGVSAPLMERLVAAAEAALAEAPGAAAGLAGLRAPARLLAAREPLLWTAPAHPWWRLLDRLLVVAGVHDDGEPAGAVLPAVALALQRLQEAGPLDAASCQQAAETLERIAARRLQERRQRIAPLARALQAQADLQELQLALRDQILVQLRSTPTSAPLRRFLVGPWSLAMAHAARSHGLNAPELDALALQVDALIRATKRPGRPVALALRVALLEVTRGALARAEFPAASAEAELARLDAVLRDPPPSEDAPPPSAAETRVDTMDLPAATRMSTLIDLDSALEVAGHARWLDTLQPGDAVRLFLHDRWTNAQLVWVSTVHHLFVFDGRRGDGTHALSRRLLARLRTAGLALPLDEGTLLALAVQPLLTTDLAQS
jgi:hypothetical protein